MGLEITRERFEEEDFRRFADKLDRNLHALQRVLARPHFGEGPTTLGAELELHLVDEAGRPQLVNRRVLADSVDPRLTLEVNRFNLEINTHPCPMAGEPFLRLEQELETALEAVRCAARTHGARPALIGILPTLEPSDLSASALTDGRRYRALSAGVRRIRPTPITVRIEGDEVLEVAADDVTFEGANASFQVHLRVPPDRFVAAYNAAQIATAPVLAICGNSPLFLGKRLWRETRVALFRQSVDDRTPTHGASPGEDWRPARVSFGHGWLRHSVLELFNESVSLHEPLLPEVGSEEPEEVLGAGGIPRLDELRLHHGTVWRWNRAIYDHGDGGHLRIELRALPAGPTVPDMVAGAAFLLGLTLGLEPRIDEFLARMTFGHARHNFYEAARWGIDAELLWPTTRGISPGLEPARSLVERLLPVAERGLRGAGVSAEDSARWLGIIARRVDRGVTGACWQERTYDGLLSHPHACEALKSQHGPSGRGSSGPGAWQGAARAMLLRYLELSESGEPVHGWPR
jgi:hypothetical protein